MSSPTWADWDSTNTRVDARSPRSNHDRPRRQVRRVQELDRDPPDGMLDPAGKQFCSPWADALVEFALSVSPASFEI